MATHRHAVLLAKQLHADLVHVGGDVPLGLVQVLCVSLHQGLGDPAAAVLRGEQKCGVRRGRGDLAFSKDSKQKVG